MQENHDLIWTYFIVKTPTQLQLNNNSTKVGFDMKMTLHTTHHPTPPPHRNSISVISQLLLTRFTPNFKGRFLGPFWTDLYCHCDICLGNICHGDICPYEEYLICYWSDFDQTLKAGSWDHLLQIQLSWWHLSNHPATHPPTPGKFIWKPYLTK